MRIRFEIEPCDLVRAAQRRGEKLDAKVAAQMLKNYQPGVVSDFRTWRDTICTTLLSNRKEKT